MINGVKSVRVSSLDSFIEAARAAEQEGFYRERAAVKLLRTALRYEVFPELLDHRIKEQLATHRAQQYDDLSYNHGVQLARQAHRRDGAFMLRYERRMNRQELAYSK